MNTDQLLIKLKEFDTALPEVRDRLILDAVFSSNALEKRRIIGDRKNADGGIFGIYSPAYLKRRIKKGKGADQRVNFSYTGKMMQSTQPHITSSSDEEVIIRIAPLDPQREKVMGYLEKDFGEILTLSQSEIDIIIEDFTAGIQDFLNNHFNS